MLSSSGKSSDSVVSGGLELDSSYGIAMCVTCGECDATMDVAYSVSAEHGRVRKLMDSGCSRCMSGVKGRLITQQGIDSNVSGVSVSGFNNTRSSVDAVGKNEDNKMEFFVKSMPVDLVLLSAHDYARDGAIVLYGDSGYVYKLTKWEESEVRLFMEKFMPDKTLCVNNRTYEVVDLPVDAGMHVSDVSSYGSDGIKVLVHGSEAYTAVRGDSVHVGVSVDDGVCSVGRDVVLEHGCGVCSVQGGDEAHAASTYFNTKVNVSNVEERIMVYLISGLTLKDMFSYVKNGSVSGLHPDVTTKALNAFKHKWGSTPDAFQLANPGKEGNRKGYMSESVPPTKCGEYVEMDFMECNFNEVNPNPKQLTDEQLNGLRRRTKVTKLATHGGAIAACVSVDVFSGFVRGELVMSTARPLDIVKRCVQRYEMLGHKIENFCADSGVSSQSMFQVFTPEVEGYLLEKGIQSHRAEPYNHSNGTEHVENVIGTIKRKMGMAVNYILRNPNFHLLQFSKLQVLKMWGELFYWAIITINLSRCVNNLKLTKYEMFRRVRPNIQEIRLLPIFSIVMVYRHVATAAVIDNSNGAFYQYGLYVGPDTTVVGGIRVAVLTGDGLRIVVTTKYKGVSDGGGMDIYQHVERGVERVLTEGVAVPQPVVTYIDEEDVRRGVQRQQVVIATDDSTGEAQLRGEIIPASGNSGQHSDSDSSGEEVQPKRVSNQGVGVRGTNGKRKGTVSSKENGDANGNDTVKGSRRVVDQSKWPSRATRASRRELGKVGIVTRDSDSTVTACGVDVVVSVDEVVDPMKLRGEDCMFSDWSTHTDGDHYYSFVDNVYYAFSCNDGCNSVYGTEVGYRIVTEGVPKSMALAYSDPRWGEPARIETANLMDAKTLVRVDDKIARDDIKNGADVVMLFPIYEEKIKEGKLVSKVRLVCNGRTQHHAGATYSPTPTKEELFVLLHMCAKLGWDYCHIDEVRAFLNAKYKGKTSVYARMKGDSAFYKILGALYGLKTSPRDYGIDSGERLISLGFKRLHMCSCIFVKRFDNGHVVLVYAFVDDYIPCGSDRATTEAFVTEFQTIVKTTPPEWNATSILGMTIIRDWDKCTIQISLAGKIAELGLKLGMAERAKKEVPIPSSGYIVHDYQFEEMGDKESALFLEETDIILYMQIVGSLIWISGVRHEINYGLMYLTWFTKKPRVHHLVMAYYMVSYLYYSKDIPLVLGGKGELCVEAYSDSSWGTGPKGRSICAVLVRLGEGAACITARATASLSSVRMSSFESELEGVTLAVKTLRRIVNILEELGFELISKPKLYNDNLSMIRFVKGEGVAKGVRHMELRMWYTREQYAMGSYELEHMKGTTLPADRITKPQTREEHAEYRYFALGLGLL